MNNISQWKHSFSQRYEFSFNLELFPILRLRFTIINLIEISEHITDESLTWNAELELARPSSSLQQIVDLSKENANEDEFEVVEIAETVEEYKNGDKKIGVS